MSIGTSSTVPRDVAAVRTFHVLHVVNDLDTGGAQTLLETLARTRPTHQRLSLCVLGSRGKLSERLESVFDDVRYLEFSRASWAVTTLVRRLRDVVAELRPDIVHTHLLHADLAAALTRKHQPVVTTVHTTGMADGDKLRSRVLGYVVGGLARRFDAIVACDPTCESYLRRMRYPMARTEVIVNGVEVPSTTLSLPGADRTPIVLSLSRWHPMKDHANLFGAVAELTRRGIAVRLLCAGSGMTADNAEVTELAERYGVTEVLELLGPRNDVADLLESARVFVLSSAYGEALPMSGLEALAAGRPVVTTDVGGCSALAVEAGLVVPPEQPAALADALAAVVGAAPSRWTELAAAARARAEGSYDARRTVQAYDAVYRRLLAAERGN